MSEDSTMSISNRVALVTGGAQGLGKSFARALLTRGAKVGITDINEDLGKTTLSELAKEFGEDKVAFVKCDVSNEAQVKDTFATISDKFGGLDIVVNNAGIGLEFEGWQKTIDVNLKGTIAGTTTALDKMRKDKGGNGGVIINVSSMAGINPNPSGPVYAASKAGIIFHSLSFAANPEVLANGVRINLLCPAFVDTAMFQALGATKLHVPQIAEAIVAKVGIMTAEYVASSMMELIEDETKHGAVMMLSQAGGKQFKQSA